MTKPTAETDLAAAIAAVYQAPFEEFVAQRDALAKRLRAEKRRDDAALVKALRKPSRMAWVLDHVAGEDAESIEKLSEAIAHAQTAADLRAALETVKEAVRSVAAVGARIAVRAEHPVEPNAIATAIYAIIGDAPAFTEFREGRLVEIPEGGGLDLLSALTPRAAPPAKATSHKAKPAHHHVEPPPKEDPRIALAASARAELKRVEKSLDAAREKLREAKTSVREAKEQLEVAEHAVRRAQAELETRQKAAERADERVVSATEDVEEAERAVEKAKARIEEFD